MSCGKPVISFDSGGAPEYLGETGIVVKTGDIALLAREIAGLVKDSGKRETLGKAARERAERIFGKESVARESVDLYMEGMELFRVRRGRAE
jgi:glycosyltransferase involved in cell wall biosynthesis